MLLGVQGAKILHRALGIKRQHSSFADVVLLTEWCLGRVIGEDNRSIVLLKRLLVLYVKHIPVCGFGMAAPSTDQLTLQATVYYITKNQQFLINIILKNSKSGRSERMHDDVSYIAG